jgi:hypothetical protein
MPKHNWGPTLNVTKDNIFIGFCRIIITTKKTKIDVKSKDVAT